MRNHKVTMVCKRRCMKLGTKQRLLLVGGAFVCVMILLHRISLNSGKRTHAVDLPTDKIYDKFPHYPDQDFNLLDRERALLEPFMNQRYADKEQGNDFEQDRVHIGHSLLSESVLIQIRSTLLKISPNVANAIPDIEDFIVDTSEMLQGSDVKSRLTCKDVDGITVQQEVDVLNKKLVYKGLHRNWQVTIKAPWKDLTTKTRCLQKFSDLDRCTAQMNFQVVREILLHSVLHHPNIVNMLGYCMRGDVIHNYIGGNGVIAVTEIGMSCPPQFLSGLKWRRRLEMIESIAKLLIYLESSPLGSLRMIKVTSKDFVCVKDTLKYADLDELRLGELTCKVKKDCFYDGKNVGIPCDFGQCKGLNAKSNLKKVYDAIIIKLLKGMPKELSYDIHALIVDCEKLRMTPVVLLKAIQHILKVKVDEEDVEPENVVNRKDTVRNEEALQVSDSTDHQYLRVNMSNLPGMYDFGCMQSRVTWGCVYDAQGLDDAMMKCNGLRHCKAFVAFTKFPEVSKLFTIVLKSAGDGIPIVQEGVTLFIKKTTETGGDEGPEWETNDNKLDNIQSNKLDRDDGIKNDGLSEKRQCTQNLFKDQKKSRRSAEKRLMTHLGMKGIEEKSWLNEVKGGLISGSYPLIDTDGQFMVTFDTDRADGIDRAIVITETGDNKHYLAQAITFFMDRLLGLYHVPPTAVVQLPTRSLTTAWDEPWFKPYKSLINNGFLPAVMTVPKPKAITAQDIILPRPESYVREVVSLSKKQRVQMEYLIIMWLTRMPQPKSGHIGYKGHLVHFESDQGFLNLSQSWILNYFYNCQFPKSVAHLLGCFRCAEGTKKMKRICSLGQEVLNLVWPGDLSSVKVKVANKSARELETIINNAASRLLIVIDKCARLFTKDVVLY